MPQRDNSTRIEMPPQIPSGPSRKRNCQSGGDGAQKEKANDDESQIVLSEATSPPL